MFCEQKLSNREMEICEYVSRGLDNKQIGEKLGISEGQKIKLVGEEIEVQGTAHVNGIHDGMIGVTELFGNLIENIVSSKDINPMASASKLELTPVKIEKIDQRQ